MSAKKHPAQRFEEMLRPHFGALYAAAQRMTLSTTDAEDLVQDVCLKAFTRLEELEEIEYRKAWLLRVMYHRFIDNQRSSQRSAVDLAETGDSSVDPAELAQPEWLPDEMLDSEIRITRILMAMKRLDNEQCALVALRDIEGLTIAELEALTGKPAGTIKSQLSRTRSKLGRLLTSDSSLKPKLKAIGG